MVRKAYGSKINRRICAWVSPQASPASCWPTCKACKAAANRSASTAHPAQADDGGQPTGQINTQIRQTRIDQKQMRQRGHIAHPFHITAHQRMQSAGMAEAQHQSQRQPPCQGQHQAAERHAAVSAPFNNRPTKAQKPGKGVIALLPATCAPENYACVRGRAGRSLARRHPAGELRPPDQ